MKQRQQIQGYSHSPPAHTNPISALNNTHDKEPKHESLIQKCMKALIKEKMSGCLINAGRRRRDCEENGGGYGERAREGKGRRDGSQGSVLGFLNSSIKRSRYQDPENIIPISAQAGSKHSRHQSTLASINERLSKISSTQPQNPRHPSLTQLTQTSIPNNKIHQNPHRLSQLKKNIELSFISAIDHGDDETNTNINAIRSRQSPIGSSLHMGYAEKEDKERVKLPKIKMFKSRNVSGSLLVSPTSIIKNVLKKTTGYNIAQDFWRLLTNQSTPTPIPRKLSTSIADLLLPSYSASAPKQPKSSLFKPTIPSSSRQSIQAYISSLPTPFIRLLDFVLAFFQIKLPAEVSALHYSGVLEEINGVNERAWAIVAFVFWDFDRDGVVRANDLFGVFREFNNFQEGKDSAEGVEGRITQRARKQNEQPKKIRKQIRHEKNSNKELMSSTEDIVNALKQFRPREEMSRNLTNTESKGSAQLQQSLTKGNLKDRVLALQNVQKAINSFKEQLEHLNETLSSAPFQQIDISTLKQPLTHPISYLQQIALSNSPNPTQTLKYKQILPLFSAGSGSGSSSNDHKLQIFPKDLTIKVASSYKQCFISTEHNEETRLVRESIDQFKQLLRKKREARNLDLEEKYRADLKINKEINYVRLAESGMGQVIKEIVMNLLGYQA